MDISLAPTFEFLRPYPHTQVSTLVGNGTGKYLVEVRFGFTGPQFKRGEYSRVDRELDRTRDIEKKR